MNGDTDDGSTDPLKMLGAFAKVDVRVEASARVFASAEAAFTQLAELRQEVEDCDGGYSDDFFRSDVVDPLTPGAPGGLAEVGSRRSSCHPRRGP